MDPECRQRYLELLEKLDLIRRFCEQAKAALSLYNVLQGLYIVFSAITAGLVAAFAAYFLLVIILSLTALPGLIIALGLVIVAFGAITIAMYFSAQAALAAYNKFRLDRLDMIATFLTLLDQYFIECPEADRDDPALVIPAC